MRRSPMPRCGGPLARSRSLTRAALPRRTKPMPAGLKRAPMSPTFRQQVFELSDGLCALCGRRRLPDDDWAAHHRLLRSQGGKDTAANVIPVHHSCHMLVHGRPEWSYAHGFLVPSWGDPESWPVFRRLTRWQQPTENGWISAVPNVHQTELGETA